MALGLDSGILQFNVESEPELRALSRVAQARGRSAAVCLRINPDVDAQTHAKITTGKSENKFGIELVRAGEIADLAARLPGIELAGGRHPYRLAAHLDRAVPRRLRAARRAGARPDRARARAAAHRSRRRPRRVLRQRRRARPQGLCAGGARRGARAPARHHPGAGPLPGRRCRHPADARHLREGRRHQALRHRRRGDERPDPADPLRGLDADPAGRASPPPAPRPARSTSSARSARAATTWRSTGPCRRWRPAT